MTRFPLPDTRVAWSVSLLTILLLGLASCAAFPASTAPVVRIGLVAPFEGRFREIGYDVIYAARLAIREWNGRGGVQGYRVELVALDDGGDPELAARAAQRLALDPMVVGVVGHWLEEATAVARPVYQEARMPLIATDEVEQAESNLRDDFVVQYQAVAPFGESPGPHAKPAYDACNALIAAIGAAIAADGEPTRSGVALALTD